MGEHAGDLLELRGIAAEIVGSARDPVFLSVLMLLATTRVGPDGRRVATYIQEPLAKVLPRARRMTELGIWSADSKSFIAWWIDDAHEDRGDEAMAGILLDAMAVEGLIQRIPHENERPTYAANEYVALPALAPPVVQLALPPHEPQPTLERTREEKLAELRARGFGGSRR